MDSLAQHPISVPPVSASPDALGSHQASADCFLTYANDLVAQILVEYRIEIKRDADCAVA
jgi:hypothetical protein